ncbi:Hpt domain-containing protein [Paenibacillus nicotianae]|uniref:Hpt domain-containing protein n=1 Tax=Paenibacillus nicotianae TaxID=1526551 RepID=A0ABW4UPX8_9BACL
MSKADRYQQIIQQTRIRFLADASLKMQDLQHRFEDYDHGRLSADQRTLPDCIHRHAHAIKGLALTLSYEDIDHICEKILTYILYQPDHVWTAEDIHKLRKMVTTLDQLLTQASSAQV